jgi:hypothetical protein
MPKPIINFNDFMSEIKSLDAVSFKEKWGIEKDLGKQILDGLWLDQLMSFTNKTENEVLEMIVELAKSDSGETFDIEEKELFMSGHHNGKTYTEKDIEEIVKNTNLLIEKDSFKIPLKLGHDNDKTLSEAFKQMLDSDSMPAFGFVENIKKVGNKIVGDYKNIPKQLYNLIDKGLFPKKSAEIYLNYKDNDGKSLGKVLSAIALLGAAQPAIPNLYNKNSEKDVVIQGEKPMTTQPTEEEIKAKLQKEQAEKAAEEAKETAIKEELAKKEKAITDEKARADKAEQELENYKKQAREEKIEAQAEKILSKGAVYPHQKNAVVAILGKIEGSEEKVKFSKAEGKEEEVDIIKAFEELLDNRPKIEFRREYSKDSNPSEIEKSFSDADKDAIKIFRNSGKTEDEIKSMFL